MKYKKIFSAIISIIVLSGICSCGKNNGNSPEKAPEIVGDNEIVSSAKDNDSETPDKIKKNPDDTSVTTIASSQKSDADKNVTTAAKGHIAGVTTSSATAKKTHSSPTNSTSGGGNSTTSSAGDTHQQTAGNSHSGGTASPSGSGGNSGDTGLGENSGVTEPSTAPPNITAAEEYTAEVTLSSSPSYIGNNVSVEGSVVKINAGGDYIFTGNVSGGQIYVNTQTEEKVTLILNGVDIFNPSGPAIFIDEAKKCTIKIKEGSVNTLSDGGNDKINDGVIFSNDTLRFKGSGTLNITSGNAHGIASDDDIIIENGTYNIISVKSGILAHDDITVNGGNLDVKGGTNGIKSKGTLNINGGYSIISGGTKEEKSSIYSEGDFNYSGGCVFAAGNKVTVPTGTDIPYIVADLGTSYDAGSEVEMVLNDVQMASFTPHNNFKCLMMLSPEISVGSSFYTVINGNASETNIVNDIQNIF